MTCDSGAGVQKLIGLVRLPLQPAQGGAKEGI